MREIALPYPDRFDDSLEGEGPLEKHAEVRLERFDDEQGING